MHSDGQRAGPGSVGRDARNQETPNLVPAATCPSVAEAG